MTSKRRDLNEEPRKADSRLDPRFFTWSRKFLVKKEFWPPQGRETRERLRERDQERKTNKTRVWLWQGFTWSTVPSVVLLVLLLLDPVLMHKTNHIKIKFRILAV